MTTPTPGQPLSDADVSLLKGDLLLCPIWGVVQFDRFDDSKRRAFVLDLKNNQVRLMAPAKMAYLGRPDQDGWIAWGGGENPVGETKIDVRFASYDEEPGLRADRLRWSIGHDLGDIIAYRPHAPVSRPGDGVEWPAVTNAWAETYCELTGKNPDGQQVTFVDGATVTTFRDMAKREIEAMLCAAPKAAVRAIAALTPPAEPVSRPAGEGEIEEALSCLADYDHTGRLEKAVRSALRPQPPQQVGAGEGEREAVALIAELEALENGTVSERPWIAVELAERAAKALRLSLLRPAAPDAGGWTADKLTGAVSDETMRHLLSAKDVGSGRARLASILNALQPGGER
jgi:hypothetical protein